MGNYTEAQRDLLSLSDGGPATADDDNYVMNEAEQAALEKYYEVTRNGSVEERLDRLEKAVQNLDTKLSTILETVDGIMQQAGPVIKQIAESPMVKMITGGK